MLQDLYQDWDRNHGRHQTELQMLIRAQLVEAIGPEQAEAFIDNARMQAHKQLAPRYFPQRPVADSAYCGKLLPQTQGRGADAALWAVRAGIQERDGAPRRP